jgi:transcription initiation factor TFIIH subunit 2
MADSDEDYVGEISDGDLGELNVQTGGPGTAAGTRARRKKQRGGAEWEVSRTWETLVEGVDGTLSSTVEGLLEAGKRKR